MLRASMHFENPGGRSIRSQVLDEFRTRRTPWGCVATVPDETDEDEEPPAKPAPARLRRIVQCSP